MASPVFLAVMGSVRRQAAAQGALLVRHEDKAGLAVTGVKKGWYLTAQANQARSAVLHSGAAAREVLEKAAKTPVWIAVFPRAVAAVAAVVVQVVPAAAAAAVVAAVEVVTRM
jgi:hypothetical protein